MTTKSPRQELAGFISMFTPQVAELARAVLGKMLTRHAGNSCADGWPTTVSAYLMSRAHLALVLVALSGSLRCSCKPELTRGPEFELQIRERFAEFGATVTRLQCPKRIDPTVGRTFTCDVELGAAKVYTLKWTVIHYDLKTGQIQLDDSWADRMISSRKLEEVFGEHPELVMDCGEPIRSVPADGRVFCELSGSGYKGRFWIDLDSNLRVVGSGMVDQLILRSDLEEKIFKGFRDQVEKRANVGCHMAPLVRYDGGVVWCDITQGAQSSRVKVLAKENPKTQGFTLEIEMF